MVHTYGADNSYVLFKIEPMVGTMDAIVRATLDRDPAMETAAKRIRTAARRARCRPASGRMLLLCSDLLVLCAEVGSSTPRGRGTLSEAVRSAERSRPLREHRALAPPF